MFAFLTKNRTQRQQQQLVAWVKKAKNITDPLEVKDILLSDWSFSNKVSPVRAESKRCPR